ncbi:twin-arginine translocase TatA/TatE family subunit [Elioraea rosea]|uniref:twin-arginine translocase TatA/TatE family subunit n=1 Tax=Elioraea rosea TaxID=2492390 RepID=UPI0011841639|nr:twin-arginine translocase TatA/TatE family subunit [Elioraea rosea]
MGTFSIWHWLVVLLVILLLFGSGKISGLMGDLAKGIKSFKQNIKEDEKPETATAEQKPAGSLAGPEAQATARTGETTSAPRG